MGIFSCMGASKPANEPGNNDKLSVAISTEPVRLVDQGTQTEDTFVQEVGVTSSTGGSIKRSACSQDLQPPSPQQKGQKGTVSSKDATNLYAMMSPPQSKSAPDSNESPETLMATSEEAATNCELRKVFIEFARFGTRSQTKHMDIFRFMKMCRECGLLLRQQDVSSIDLIFYKVTCTVPEEPQQAAMVALRCKPKHVRAVDTNGACSHWNWLQCKEQKSNRLSYSQFRDALRHIAKLLDTSVEQVKTKIISSQGPLVNNITLPKFIKQHDVDCTTRSATGPRTPEAGYGAAAPQSIGADTELAQPERNRTKPAFFPPSPPRGPKSLSMIQA